MNQPFFSVIIPTFNRSKLLKQSIESVLQQSFNEFELIIVDDNSTDDTKDIVKTFSDKRIRYVINNHSNGGAGARNCGIFYARGKWIVFLDDDDIWTGDKLFCFFKKILIIQKDVGLIYSGYATYDFENKKIIKQYYPHKKRLSSIDLLYKNYIGTLSVVGVRADLLKRIGGFDERLAALQDIDLYVRVAQKAKIDCINECLSLIRIINPDRISLNVDKKLDASILFWNKYKRSFGKNFKLSHRAASRVFLYAFLANDIRHLLKSLPWVLSGIFLDLPNIVWLIKNLTGKIILSKECTK